MDGWFGGRWVIRGSSHDFEPPLLVAAELGLRYHAVCLYTHKIRNIIPIWSASVLGRPRPEGDLEACGRGP